MSSLENLTNVYYSKPNNYDTIKTQEQLMMGQNTRDGFVATQTNVIPTKGFNQNILNQTNNNKLILISCH